MQILKQRHLPRKEGVLRDATHNGLCDRRTLVPVEGLGDWGLDPLSID